MVLLDTNIFTYLANGTIAAEVISGVDIAYASISKIEALGFPTIQANELLLLNALFDEAYNLDLTDSVVVKAIELRQTRRMSLGDAIIAATALQNNLELWTANVDDFKNIDGLTLHNPH